jgi:hypothetical protein
MSNRLKVACIAAMSFALFLILMCAAFYVWWQRQHSTRAYVATIERLYGNQLKLLADCAADYEHVSDVRYRDREKIKRLLADAAIVRAKVYRKDSQGTKWGIGLKPTNISTAGMALWYDRAASVGNPTVYIWEGGGRRFIEYSAVFLDQNGFERSYTITFDESKMDKVKE